MDTFATHHPHKIHPRTRRLRVLGRGFDMPFIQDATVALPVSLLL